MAAEDLLRTNFGGGSQGKLPDVTSEPLQLMLCWIADRFQFSRYGSAHHYHAYRSVPRRLLQYAGRH